MGNNPSTTHPKSSSTSSPAGSTHGAQAQANTGSPAVAPSERRREPKLRESVHSQRGAPPESSQVQARGTTSTHRTRPLQSQPQPSSQRPSYTQSGSQRQSRYEHNEYAQPYAPPQHASPSNNSPYSASPKNRSSQAREQQPAQTQSHQTPTKPNSLPQYPENSKPVAVPQPVSSSAASDASNGIKSPYVSSHVDSTGMLADTMSHQLNRPPRLPLPIEEEVHTPGSPILGPADAQTPVPDLDPLEMGEALTGPLSAMSGTDDDEDDEELPIDKSRPLVPTPFTWRGDPSSQKVYVTGTIFNWNRKSKLHPVQGKPGYWQAIVPVHPGTHHIRFIVDGNMNVSPELPTTVDFGNNLVNYIEVSSDDVPRHDDGDQSPYTEYPAHGNGSNEDDKRSEDKRKPVRTKPVLGRKHYASTIPQYLLDLDKPEDSSAYRYAAAAIQKLPTPPSLPGFLGKPILNQNPPMKDDNSVLIMPNHTVLNHLATSSIKGNVLAVSATTRYKRKYVTTIMYKPTSDDTT